MSSVVWEVFKTNMFVQICLDCILVYWLCKRKNLAICSLFLGSWSGTFTKLIEMSDSVGWQKFPNKGTVVLVSFAEYR